MVGQVASSYKTTAIGVVTLVAAACDVIISLYNGDAPNFTALMAAVSGLGFLFSKDADK